jgi:hypothetical protein
MATQLWKVISRRGFLAGATAALGAGLAKPLLAQNPPPAPAASTAVPERPPAISADLVKAFVIAGHGDLPNVKTLLAATPGLINACWDWGGGDFETALGGAAHMGRRDIAEFLLGSNARLDVFAAAMLGQLEIVRTACVAFPNLPRVAGPHGIPLIAHAKKGGDAAAPVVAYLESLPPAVASGGLTKPEWI